LQSQDIEKKEAFVARVLMTCANCYESNLEAGTTIEEEAEYLVNLIGSLFVYSVEHRGIDPLIVEDIIVILNRIAKDRYEEEIPVM